MESIPVFSALAWSPAKGQRIAIVNCDRQRPANGSGLANRTILIDGRRWFCTAVDRDARATGPIVPREKIYLWVREPSAG
jgi:hypothetical protein